MLQLDDRDMLTLDDVIYTDVSEGDEFKLPAVWCL